MQTRNKKDKFIKKCRNYKHASIGENTIKVEATIEVDEITPKFLYDAEEFFNTGLSYGTIGRYIKNLRAIINNSEKSLLIGDNYPFGSKENGKYSLSEADRREIEMKITDIRKIENFATDDSVLF